LLVVAKTDKTHEGLATLFATHDIERKYLAIVSGVPAPPAGVIRTQIGRSSTNRLKMAVLFDDTVEHAADDAGGGRGGTGSRNPDANNGAAKIRGKRAVTHYRLEEAFKASALVGCTLETGRTHQVRVHLAHIGHALIGDPVYANRQKAYKIGPDQVIFKRQALHATSLGFIHPITGEKLYFACNLPDDMQELLRQLRI
jgi:23S rRNA pseudouridine1911/1915/1917 synthase